MLLRKRKSCRSFVQGLVREKKCVTLSKLRKEFHGGCGSATKVAVDGVDLTLTEGSITVLLGHNGAGAYPCYEPL
jgi:ABC-type branched-subunit amino acid transport system ATPase component